MAEGEKAKAFITESLNVKDECKQCRYFAMCRGGGCKRDKASENYCEAYKKFFSSCMPLFSVFRK